MKKGFTLIEMLVVVLIIGILAGVALPQYTNAVRKARVAEAKITLRALIDATDRYILANGDTSWNSLDDLDVGVETDTKNWTIETSDCLCKNSSCACYAVAYPKSEEDYVLYYYSPNINEDDGWPGRFECCSDSDKGKKICKQLGGIVEFDDDYGCYFL